LTFLANAIILSVTVFAYIRAIFLTRPIIYVALLTTLFAWVTSYIVEICTVRA
jgi:hypothetical protein